jgi:hypothetical protein
MKAALIRFKRILREIRSEKILNKIESGKIVYFENSLEEIAFKCVHSEIGKPSRYFVKHYGRDEYEIDFDSSYIIMAALEGKPISKARYDRYHLIEGNLWNRDFKIPSRTRQWVISG